MCVCVSMRVSKGGNFLVLLVLLCGVCLVGVGWQLYIGALSASYFHVKFASSIVAQPC